MPVIHGAKILRRWPILALLVVATGAFTILSVTGAEAQDAPPIPHKLAEHEQCLNCHGTQGSNPIPSNHSTFDEKSCLSCHSTLTPTVLEEGCLSCHGQSGLSMNLPSGEKLPLYIDNAEFSSSIHGGKLLCSDCHSSINGYPHPKRNVSSIREYNLALYEACKNCHFDNYAKTLDSVHYKILASGEQRAPVCTDCHGAHNVTVPSQPRAKISQTCSQCHQELYQEYINSVHGKALIQEQNLDVPVCTDCHLTHTIQDPRTASFRVESVTLCSNCHSNEKLMQKYGISTQVVKTYLQDFHGATIAMAGKEKKDIWVKEAVCTDCHGVHDIQAIDSPNSPAIKANLVKVCRSCHPNATSDFPSAWLSHYEPTLEKAPIVYLVRRFYWVIIPFIVVGLLAHILIDVWRTITNR